MRIHPISWALRALRGARTLGGRPLPDPDEAVDALRLFTGQDFGRDAAAWGAWLRANRRVYQEDGFVTPVAGRTGSSCINPESADATG